MSVIKFGPEGYDYQYLASLYVILSFSLKKDMSGVFVDSKESEDLSITYIDPSTGRTSRVDFEFKKRIQGLDFKSYAKWITKFEASRKDKYILSKLEKDEIQAFYILTSARAGQFAEDLGLIPKSDAKTKPKVKRSKKLLSSFKETLKLVSKPLKPEKRAFIEQHLDNLKAEDLEGLIDKLFIIDNLEEQNLHLRIGDLLFQRGIVASAQSKVVNNLLEILKNNRFSGNNIVKPIFELLRSSTTSLPPLMDGYLIMDDGETLYQYLKEKRILLLTGATLCGKTQYAYHLITKLVSEWPDFHYKAVTDIQSARQFLFENDSDARICYLEDPFGQHQNPESQGIFRLLESLILNMPKDKERYLICTSAKEVLSGMNLDSYLNHFQWFDLTIKESQVSLNIWNKLVTSNRNITGRADKIVRSIINKQAASLLQPGQLAFLAHYPNLNNLKTANEVTHAASFRAHDITQLILSRDPAEVRLMIILGLAASTQIGLKEKELIYLSGDNDGYLPGINKSRSLIEPIIDIDNDEEPKFRISEYEFGSSKNPYEQSLSSLLDQRLVKLSGNGITFNHPIYQEAARNLFDGNNPIRFKQTVKYARKLIGCLDPQVALHAVGNLNLLISSAVSQEQRESVIEAGFEAAESTFVMVRDSAILFLVGCSELLKDTQLEILRKYFERRPSFGNENFFWQDGVAFIPSPNRISLTLTTKIRHESKEHVLAEWGEFLKTKPVLSCQKALGIMKGLVESTENAKKRILFDVSGLKYFLQFEEAFIRERAAFLIAASIEDNNILELDEIYFENDPYVRFQLVKGLFRSWPYIIKKENKDRLLGFMKNAFNEPFVTLSATPLFTQFASGYANEAFDWRDDIEDSAHGDMWYLWGELMPDFFKYLPPNIRVHDNRFMMALREARISVTAKNKILEAAVMWIPAHLASSEPVTDLSETLLIFLFENLQNIPLDSRYRMLQLLLNTKSSKFLANLVTYLIICWDKLAMEEQSTFIDLLPRLPEFVRMVAFTTEKAPVEVQMAAESFKAVGMDMSNLLALMPEQLILKSLTSVYIDEVASYIGYRDESFWNPLLRYYINAPDTKGFGISMIIFLEDILIKESKREGLWTNPSAIFKHAVEKSTGKGLLVTFKILLNILISFRASPVFGKYLRVIYEAAHMEQQMFIQQKICQNVEVLSRHQNSDIIVPYLNMGEFKDEFEADTFVLNKLEQAEENKNNIDWQRDFVQATLLLVKDRKLRFFESAEGFEEWAAENENILDSVEKERITECMSYMDEISSSQWDLISSDYQDIYKNYLSNY